MVAFDNRHQQIGIERKRLSQNGFVAQIHAHKSHADGRHAPVALPRIIAHCRKFDSDFAPQGRWCRHGFEVFGHRQNVTAIHRCFQGKRDVLSPHGAAACHRHNDCYDFSIHLIFSQIHSNTLHFLQKILSIVAFLLFLQSILIAAVAQLVEHQLPKLRVASSSLVCRSHKDVPFQMARLYFFTHNQFNRAPKSSVGRPARAKTW